MDWLTFISNVIASLAWPAVAIVLLYLLRPQLSDLAERLRELTLPGTKAVFAEKLEKVKEKFEEIEIRGEIATTEGSGDVAAIQGTVTAPPEDDPYLRLVDVSPHAAVMYAFREVEDALLSYNDLFPNRKHKLSPIAIILRLSERGLVAKDIGDLYRRLQDTRNAAAHGEGNDSLITFADAFEYRRLCRFLADLFRAKIEAARLIDDANKALKATEDGSEGKKFIRPDLRSRS